jgi:hypothetical protein
MPCFGIRIAALTPSVTRLAACATAGFTAAAIAGALSTVQDWQGASPLLGFHALLLIHSYFSIERFSGIAPRQTVLQIVTDCVLVALYFYLPFQFANPTRYLEAIIVLFLVAIVKYALILATPGYARLLTRKMFIDLLAALACGLALAGIRAGVPHVLGCWLCVFLFSHIYILGVGRFYFSAADPTSELVKAPK